MGGVFYIRSSMDAINKIGRDVISVIIPIHNRFGQVDEAIASVIEQTYRPIELIIVDDCSDYKYIPNIAIEPELEVKIIRHTKNLGPGLSRESGRLVATGDLICYINSDDLWHPQKLEKQVEKINEDLDAGMCYCKSIEFSSLPLIGSEQIRKRCDQNFSNFFPTIF